MLIRDAQERGQLGEKKEAMDTPEEGRRVGIKVGLGQMGSTFYLLKDSRKIRRELGLDTYPK